jgi:hypothetical protein
MSAKLVGCTTFSKIDLKKGYYQIPVAAEDMGKTAVITHFGLFEFLQMPFGLHNAGQSFQRLMELSLPASLMLFHIWMMSSWPAQQNSMRRPSAVSYSGCSSMAWW